MLMNYRELSQTYRTLGAHGACQVISEALELGRRGEVGGLAPSDFSVRDMAEALVSDGREWVQSLDPRRGGTAVLEASDGVDVTAFSNITGQLLISEVMAGYQREEFVASRLFRNTPTRLDGEKIPGIAAPKEEVPEIHPGMPYPHIGFGEDWLETPSTTKHGQIIPVTKEAIFFDRTGMMLENANKVGELLGINKEKRCLDVLIGKTNNHNWKGTSYNTYQTTTPWINYKQAAGWELLDWTTIDAVEQIWADMKDPNTGEPILIGGTTILVPPYKNLTAARILNATEIRHGDITTGSGLQTISGNPISGKGYSVIQSRLMYSRLQSQLSKSADDAKKCWFIGDFAQAFRYMENWPITTVQAPANSEAEFNQDIVLRFKASERGVPFAFNPRFVIRLDGHS